MDSAEARYVIQDSDWRRRTAFGVEAARRIELCQHARSWWRGVFRQKWIDARGIYSFARCEIPSATSTVRPRSSDQLASGEACTVREIAGREKINEHEVTRVLHLAFLSPRIVEDIFKGRQAEDVTVYRLRRLSSLPFAWQEQAERLENLG